MTRILRDRRNKNKYICFSEQGMRVYYKDDLACVKALFKSQGGVFGHLPETVQTLCALALILAWMCPVAEALPTGAQSVSGDVQFQQSGETLNVTTAATRSIAQYDTFNVAANETVNFNLPSSQSAILNRVTGSDPSVIMGRLNSNGQVFLTNESGILFGKGSQVNASGLVASTLHIGNQDFIDGNLRFSQGSKASSVINEGQISTPGGYTALLGSAVQNTGTIDATGGSAHLAVGDNMVLDVGDNLSLNVTVNGKLKQAAENIDDAVVNGGTISAGSVSLQAQLEESLYESVVNNTGKIKATGFEFKNGEIYLGGNIDAGGLVRNDGELVAASGDITLEGSKVIQSGLISTAGETGGNITLTGDFVGLDSDSLTDASGRLGGGEIFLGGDYQGLGDLYTADKTVILSGAQVKADAIETGNGGRVIAWADDSTLFYGDISAKGGTLGGNGGFVETSGKVNLDVLGRVDTSAANGQAGSWLLDPTNIIVTSITPDTTDLTTVDQYVDANVGVGQTRIDVASINNAASNVTLQATNDITFSSAVNMVNAGVGLTAQANNNINVNNNITTNNGVVTLQADADSSGVGTLTTGFSNINTGTANVNLLGRDISHYSGITTSGDVNMTATNAYFYSPSSINAGNNFNLTVSSLTGQYGGSITAGNNANITSQGFSQYNASAITATNAINITTSGGTIQTPATASLTANTVSLTSTVLDSWGLGGAINATTLDLNGSSHIYFSGTKSFTTLDTSGVTSGGSFNLQTGSVLNLLSQPTVDLTGWGYVSSSGTLNLAPSATLRARSFSFNAPSRTVSTGDMTINSTGDIALVSGAQIAAGDNLTLNAVTTLTQPLGASITANDNLLISAYSNSLSGVLSAADSIDISGTGVAQTNTIATTANVTTSRLTLDEDSTGAIQWSLYGPLNITTLDIDDRVNLTTFGDYTLSAMDTSGWTSGTFSVWIGSDVVLPTQTHLNLGSGVTLDNFGNVSFGTADSQISAYRMRFRNGSTTYSPGDLTLTPSDSLTQYAGSSSLSSGDDIYITSRAMELRGVITAPDTLNLTGTGPGVGNVISPTSLTTNRVVLSDTVAGAPGWAFYGTHSLRYLDVNGANGVSFLGNYTVDTLDTSDWTTGTLTVWIANSLTLPTQTHLNLGASKTLDNFGSLSFGTADSQISAYRMLFRNGSSTYSPGDLTLTPSDSLTQFAGSTLSSSDDMYITSRVMELRGAITAPDTLNLIGTGPGVGNVISPTSLTTNRVVLSDTVAGAPGWGFYGTHSLRYLDVNGANGVSFMGNSTVDTIDTTDWTTGTLSVGPGGALTLPTQTHLNLGASKTFDNFGTMSFGTADSQISAYRMLLRNGSTLIAPGDLSLTSLATTVGFVAFAGSSLNVTDDLFLSAYNYDLSGNLIAGDTIQLNATGAGTISAIQSGATVTGSRLLISETSSGSNTHSLNSAALLVDELATQNQVAVGLSNTFTRNINIGSGSTLLSLNNPNMTLCPTCTLTSAGTLTMQGGNNTISAGQLVFNSGATLASTGLLTLLDQNASTSSYLNAGSSVSGVSGLVLGNDGAGGQWTLAGGLFGSSPSLAFQDETIVNMNSLTNYSLNNIDLGYVNGELNIYSDAILGNRTTMTVGSDVTVYNNATLFLYGDSDDNGTGDLVLNAPISAADGTVVLGVNLLFSPYTEHAYLNDDIDVGDGLLYLLAPFTQQAGTRLQGKSLNASNNAVTGTYSLEGDFEEAVFSTDGADLTYADRDGLTILAAALQTSRLAITVGDSTVLSDNGNVELGLDFAAYSWVDDLSLTALSGDVTQSASSIQGTSLSVSANAGRAVFQDADFSHVAATVLTEFDYRDSDGMTLGDFSGQTLRVETFSSAATADNAVLEQDLLLDGVIQGRAATLNALNGEIRQQSGRFFGQTLTVNTVGEDITITDADFLTLTATTAGGDLTYRDRDNVQASMNMAGGSIGLFKAYTGIVSDNGIYEPLPVISSAEPINPSTGAEIKYISDKIDPSADGAPVEGNSSVAVRQEHRLTYEQSSDDDVSEQGEEPVSYRKNEGQSICIGRENFKYCGSLK